MFCSPFCRNFVIGTGLFSSEITSPQFLTDGTADFSFSFKWHTNHSFYFVILAFRYALKLLHSSSVDSTEKIRNSLDDLIKQRHGTSKMLANTLSKKYLAEESSAPGVVQQRHRSSDSKASSSNSPQQITVTTTDSNAVVTTPIVISVPDDDDDDDLMEEAHLQVNMFNVNLSSPLLKKFSVCDFRNSKI